MTVYFIQRPDKTIKIGTAIDYRDRQSGLKRQYGLFVLLGLMDGNRDYEQQLHKRFAHLNTGKDGREWFYPSEELLHFISANTTLPTPKPAKSKPLPLNARLAVDTSTHDILREYANGLGVSMNDAILYLLTEHIEAGDDPLLAGYKERQALKAKKQAP